jgi:hypothetical protein
MQAMSINPETSRKVRKLYLDRYGFDDIAAMLRISRDDVRLAMRGAREHDMPPPPALSIEECHAARRLRNDGATIAEIASELNRPEEAVRAQIRAGLPLLPDHKPRGVSTHDASGERIHVPRDVLAVRQARRSAPHRDLTAELMGDPPYGFSALDRKSQQ